MDKNKRLEDGLASVNKRIDELDTNLNKRIDEVNTNLGKRIDELREFMLWGFGILFGGMLSLVGFVIWDRRSAIAPLTRTVREEEAALEELKRKEKLMEDVLTEYSKDNPPLSSLLKKKGIL